MAALGLPGLGPLWGAVLLGLQAGALPLSCRILQTRGLRLCGRWCFGLYMLHMPASYLCKRLPLPASLRGWLGLALAIAIAGVAYRLVERPLMRLGHRLP